MAASLFDKLAPYLLRPLNDEQFAVLDYAWHHRRFPRLRAPRTLTEKIMWLRIHYRDELMRRCSDKYLVRDHVRTILPETNLVPLIGVYESPGAIPFSELPDAFILKSTHASGWNVICRARATFDAEASRKKLKKYMETSYYSQGREWVYKDLTPRIVCEQLLLNRKGEVPEDYKFFCCHGEPVFIQVDFDRFGTHTRNLYDPQWRFQSVRHKGYPNNPSASPDPPEALEEMLEIARQLARPFPFVRVDLYALARQVYFGELTFLPARGLFWLDPPEFDLAQGQYLDLGRVTDHLV